VTRLGSWDEAFAFALAQGKERWQAIEYADSFFDCPACGESECGATCSPMVGLSIGPVEEAVS
jgi:hypothetical protein